MEPWTHRYVAQQAEQAAVVYRDPRITDYAEADEVRDAGRCGMSAGTVSSWYVAGATVRPRQFILMRWKSIPAKR